MLVSDGDKKPHLISCEATCVHEEVAKRIPNVRLTTNRIHSRIGRDVVMAELLLNNSMKVCLKQENNL